MEKNNRCIKCGHEWKKRTGKTDLCPACKTKYWQFPKQTKQLNDSIIENQKYTRLILSMLYFRHKIQTDIAQSIGVTQKTISVLLNELRHQDFIKNFNISSQKISQEFILYLTKKHQSLRVAEEKRINQLSEKYNKLGHTFEEVSWLKKVYSEAEAEFPTDYSPVSFLEKPSDFLINFLEDDLTSFLKNAVINEPETFGNKPMVEYFDDYIQGLLMSFNDIFHIAATRNKPLKKNKDLGLLYELLKEICYTKKHYSGRLYNLSFNG